MTPLRTAVSIVTPAGNLDVEAVFDSSVKKSCISISLFDKIFGRISGLVGRVVEEDGGKEKQETALYMIHVVFLDYYLDGEIRSEEFIVCRDLNEDMVLKYDWNPGLRAPPNGRVSALK